MKMWNSLKMCQVKVHLLVERHFGCEHGHNVLHLPHSQRLPRIYCIVTTCLYSVKSVTYHIYKKKKKKELISSREPQVIKVTFIYN